MFKMEINCEACAKQWEQAHEEGKHYPEPEYIKRETRNEVSQQTQIWACTGCDSRIEIVFAF